MEHTELNRVKQASLEEAQATELHSPECNSIGKCNQCLSPTPRQQHTRRQKKTKSQCWWSGKWHTDSTIQRISEDRKSSLPPQRGKWISKPARGPETNLLESQLPPCSTAVVPSALSHLHLSEWRNRGWCCLPISTAPLVRHEGWLRTAFTFMLRFTVCWDCCCQHRYIFNKHTRWSGVTLYVTVLPLHLTIKTWTHFIVPIPTTEEALKIVPPEADLKWAMPFLLHFKSLVRQPSLHLPPWTDPADPGDVSNEDGVRAAASRLNCYILFPISP